MQLLDNNRVTINSPEEPLVYQNHLSMYTHKEEDDTTNPYLKDLMMVAKMADPQVAGSPDKR